MVLVCGAAKAGDMPEFTGTWATDGPYSRDGVHGKVVVLLYFEEG